MLLILFKVYCISVVITFFISSFLLFYKANKEVTARNSSLSAFGIFLGTFATFLFCLIPIYNIWILIGTIENFIDFYLKGID
jgi:hypothetical protein